MKTILTALPLNLLEIMTKGIGMNRFKIFLLRLSTYVFNLPDIRQRLDDLKRSEDVDLFRYVNEELNRSLDDELEDAFESPELLRRY